MSKRGFPGQLTNTSDAFASESLVLEKSNAPFGVVLVSDSDGMCRLPDKDNILTEGASRGRAVGILTKQVSDGMPCATPLFAPIGSGETNYAKIGNIVSLIKVGAIFVRVESVVKKGDALFYRVTSSDIGTLGAIRGDADGGKAVKLNGAIFANSASAGDVVDVNLNLNTVQEDYNA